MIRTLAHLSDLHLGRSRAHHERAEKLCASLLDSEVDHVVVTGDLTHRGRYSELLELQTSFAPLIARGKLTLVPGNHDRMGDNVAAHLMNDRRVTVQRRPGLYVVQVDSTAPHNRRGYAAHGALCERVLEEISTALDGARPDELRVVALHHHVLPQVEETWAERWSKRLGWPFASELRLGPALLREVFGRCDLVLHGHRHQSRALEIRAARPLGVYNAGSATELQRYRLFHHAGGERLGEPTWISLQQPAPLPLRWLAPTPGGIVPEGIAA